MDYKIIDIEGVGDVYAEKLVAAGINKVSELLEKCAAPKGRKEPGRCYRHQRETHPALDQPRRPVPYQRRRSSVCRTVGEGRR